MSTIAGYTTAVRFLLLCTLTGIQYILCLNKTPSNHMKPFQSVLADMSCSRYDEMLLSCCDPSAWIVMLISRSELQEGIN